MLLAEEKFEKFVGTIEYPGVDGFPATGGELVLSR